MRARTTSELRRLYSQARFVIDRHYARPLTVAAVARALSSSPRQLQRAFERYGRTTFREELARRRMLAAAELLAQPAIPIAAVARLVGYRHPSHFAHAFTRRFGRSPARYRAALRAARAPGAGTPRARAMLGSDAPLARTPPTRRPARGRERRGDARAPAR